MWPALEQDVFRRHHPPSIEKNRRALHRVPQFANVAGPCVGCKHVEHLRLDVNARTVLGCKGFNQNANVSFAVAQRRQLYRKHREPVIQIFAEQLLLVQRFKIGVRGGDNAYIDFEIVIAAQSLHFTLFEKAQDFALERQGHIADLIQKECAAVGGVDAPDPRLHGTRKRAFGVAEQFRFQKRLGNGGAVDDGKGVLCAWADHMDCLRDQVLARTAFAGDEHGRFRARHHFREPVHPLHGSRAADHAAQTCTRFIAALPVEPGAHGRVRKRRIGNSTFVDQIGNLSS